MLHSDTVVTKVVHIEASQKLRAGVRVSLQETWILAENKVSSQFWLMS